MGLSALPFTRLQRSVRFAMEINLAYGNYFLLIVQHVLKLH